MSLRKFEILEMIAKGGMAEVYKAKTVSLEGFTKDVCVKKILPHLTQDDQFVTMFINEAKLAATLSYANIVQVHDLCVSADREYFIVMEYVAGKDLSDVIRAAQLGGREIPHEIAVYVAREVCKGLYYAHTKTDAEGAPLKIIHRDISPQNVLLSYMGEVKITDFGIAKASSIMNKTAVGILKGKYGYMSPEQARGEPLDSRSDIFNLGILLYEMLVGERCFAGASDYSTLNLMREAVVTPPSKINKAVQPELESIVLRCLQKEPKNRWRDALELEAALGNFAAKGGREGRSTDAARFMQELFSSTDQKKGANSTGVLALSSVVGPPPDAPGQSAQHQIDRHSQGPRAGGAAAVQAELKMPAPPKAEEPGAAALERAKKRAARGASLAADDKTADLPKAAEPAKAEPAKAEAAPPVEVKKSPEPEAPRPEPAPAKAEAAEKPVKPPKAAKAPKAEDAPAAAEAPVERKPARLKPAAEDEGKKDKKKAAEDKRPIGRKDLRPGLTQMLKAQRPGARKSWGKAAAIVLVVGALGAGAGLYQGRAASKQSVLRQLELDGREDRGEAPRVVSLMIESQPPGATVWLDGSKLAEVTPLVVERPLDKNAHDLELSLEGYKSLKKQIKLEDQPLNVVREQLAGEPGELVVRTKPTNLKVLVDGKDVGTSPLSVDVPGGERKIVIEGGEVEPLALTLRITPGQKTTLDRTLAKKGRATTARIVTEPPSKIWLDGNDTGARADGSAIAVEPGARHKVTLVDEARGLKKEIWIQLDEGEQRTYVLELGS